MHKAKQWCQEFSFLLNHILAIIEGNKAQVLPPGSNISVNCTDDNLSDKCFPIFICSLWVKWIRSVLSTGPNLHVPQLAKRTQLLTIIILLGSYQTRCPFVCLSSICLIPRLSFCSIATGLQETRLCRRSTIQLRTIELLLSQKP